MHVSFLTGWKSDFILFHSILDSIDRPGSLINKDELKIIEDFQDVSLDNSSGLAMNCECAMARKYLSPLSTKPSCCQNGNFMGKQCKEGFCFCVNMYGQQISEEFDQLDPDQPECEDFCCDNNDDESLSNWCQSHMPFKPVT